ncbi:unnamed protein product, partial [Rotaria magnacalcarata]
MDDGSDEIASNVNTVSHGNINCHSTKDFEDFFDIIDDDSDQLEFTTEELNQFFLSGHLKSIVYEDETIDDENLDDDDDKNFTELVEDNEVILSQKFSQLSTKTEEVEKSSTTKKRRRSSPTYNPDVSPKRSTMMKNHDNMDVVMMNDEHQMPMYLLTTYRLFMLMAKAITNVVNSITIDDIQQVAHLMHQIAAVEVDKEIMMTYLHSMKGTLKEPELDLIEVDRRFIPMQVKSLMLTQHKVAIINSNETTSATTTDLNTEDHLVICENLAHQRLQEINQQLEANQKQLEEKQNSLVGFTATIKQTIESYVEKY